MKELNDKKQDEAQKYIQKQNEIAIQSINSGRELEKVENIHRQQLKKYHNQED